MGYSKQVYIRVDYIFGLLKVVLTNIAKVKIRYSGNIIEFCLQLVLFSELLLKIPEGLIDSQIVNLEEL